MWNTHEYISVPMYKSESCTEAPGWVEGTGWARCCRAPREPAAQANR